MHPRPPRPAAALALTASAGIGLKPQHYRELLAAADGGHAPAWVEVHPQNYFGAGGPSHLWLTAVRDALPVSFHSTGLSLGAADGPDLAQLDALAALADRYQPVGISDHLSWNTFGPIAVPDLLPMPYTQAALDRVVRAVDQVQARLGRAILVENPSRYLAFAGDTLAEPAFLAELCARAGCGLLLDLNNIVVSATNLRFDAAAFLAAIDPALVGELHLAGHAREDHPGGPLLIDDHGAPVPDAVWALLAAFVERAGPRPTLIEWDNRVPTFDRLVAEARTADAILARAGLRHAC